MTFEEAWTKMWNDEKKIRLTSWPQKAFIKRLRNRYIMDEEGESYAISPREMTERWEIYQEPQEGHDFTWALEQMKAGKKIKCLRSNATYYIDTADMHLICLVQGEEYNDSSMDSRDMLSDKWVLT